MAANKEAIILVLDVGNYTYDAQSNGESFLQKALKCINHVVQRKMFSESKDEIGLILFGSENTDNPLAEETHLQEYQHISVYRELGSVSWHFFEQLEKIKPGRKPVDFLDALIVAMDHLKRNTENKKLSRKQIYMFSNFFGAVSSDQLKTLVKGLNAMKVEFSVIGPEKDLRDNVYETQREGERIIRKILQEMDGQSFTFDEAFQKLSTFQQRTIRSAAWKVDLTVGNSLAIPVVMYLKVREASVKTWKKSSAKEHSQKLVVTRSYHKKDEAQTECDKEELVEGYRYGCTIVPFTAEDKANMTYKCAGKCLDVLGFTDRSNVKRQYYAAASVHCVVAQTDNPSYGVALSAFIHGLHEANNKVAIVRYAYSSRSAPKIGVLIPDFAADYECLLFIQLPFAEDLRQFTFAPLNINPKLVPSDEQLAAVDNLITTMSLTKTVITAKDKKKLIDSFLPSENINPYLQHLYQCMYNRGLNAKCPIPEMSESVKRRYEPREDLLSKCEEASKKIKLLFPLKPVVTKTKATGADVFKQERTEDESGASFMMGDVGQDGMAILTDNAVTEVGTASPTEDFLTIIKNPADFENACCQLQKVIIHLVMDSFGELYRQENYSKAIRCLKVYRQESIKKYANEFNKFMNDFKNSLHNKGKLDFWEQLNNEKLLLITKEECPESEISQEQANDFLVAKMEIKDEDLSPKFEDAEDLLDMM